MSRLKEVTKLIGSFLVLAGVGYVAYLLIAGVWHQFRALDQKVALALLTGATTVIVATLTVVLGRYLERKKDIEAHFREKKVEIYDQFLQELFRLFEESGDGKEPHDLTPFFKEWKRKMITWCGQDVLKAYIDWMQKVTSTEPDAQSIWMMEDFIRAMRKDLGHSSRKIPKGHFVHLFLRDSERFIQLSKQNPNLTLAELAKIEKNLQSEALGR